MVRIAVRVAPALAALGVLALAGCSAAATGPKAPSVFETDPAPRSIAYDASELPTFRTADRAIYGRIVEVGPSPGIWSGTVATYQPVVFEVIRRLDDPDRAGGPRGWPSPGTRVTIWFGIVGPPDCDRSEPRLDPRIYRVGAAGVVAADFGPAVVGGDGMEHHIDLRARTSFHEMDEARMTREFVLETSSGPSQRPR